MKKYLPSAVYIVVFVLCTLKGAMLLDPDFGWHLKMGEHIVRHGLPATDPFSYTMPSYPFVDHEWLTNTFIYLLYGRVGMIGLALLFALISTVVLRMVVSRRSGAWHALFAVVLFCVLFPFAGIRPQVISWLMVAVFTYVLTEKKENRWWLPPLMVVWVNLHGGFFVGVGIVGVYAAVALISKNGRRSALALLALVSMATLINPYGARIWWEVYMQLTDSSLRFFVSEWKPALFFYNFTFWLYAAFAAVTAGKYRKKIPLFNRALFWVFFAAALSSMRNIPLWLIVSVPPVMAGMYAFIPEATRTAERRVRLRFVSERFRAVVVFAVILQSLVLFAGSVSPIPYPEKAVEYIRKNRLTGRIIATYGWGGYLIWKLPGVPVFIDGRMPSWRRSTAPSGESTDARKEYSAFFASAQGMRRVGGKYGVKYVLTQSAAKQTAWERWVTKTLSLRTRKPDAVTALPVVYDDGVASIRMLE